MTAGMPCLHAPLAPTEHNAKCFIVERGKGKSKGAQDHEERTTVRGGRPRQKNTFSQEPEETFACVSIKPYVGHATIFNRLKSLFLSLWEGTCVESLSVY